MVLNSWLCASVNLMINFSNVFVQLILKKVYKAFRQTMVKTR